MCLCCPSWSATLASPSRRLDSLGAFLLIVNELLEIKPLSAGLSYTGDGEGKAPCFMASEVISKVCSNDSLAGYWGGLPGDMWYKYTVPQMMVVVVTDVIATKGMVI